MSRFYPPYTTGTVCEYVGSNYYWVGEHIIKDVVLRSSSDYEYGTTQGAWIPHKELKFKEPPSRKSMLVLLKKDAEDI